jgi:hypothetical protein
VATEEVALAHLQGEEFVFKRCERLESMAAHVAVWDDIVSPRGATRNTRISRAFRQAPAHVRHIRKICG